MDIDIPNINKKTIVPAEPGWFVGYGKRVDGKVVDMTWYPVIGWLMSMRAHAVDDPEPTVWPQPITPFGNAFNKEFLLTPDERILDVLEGEYVDKAVALVREAESLDFEREQWERRERLRRAENQDTNQSD